MKVNSDIKCPGCGFASKFEFKRPSVVQPTLFSAQCDACKSDLLVKATRPQSSKHPGKENQCFIQIKITRPSAVLIAMMNEEANLKPSLEVE
jgi:DNA-directed RNA polymerase subunit RPC12/RpoP